MSRIARRALFALLPAAPLAVAGAIGGPTPRRVSDTIGKPLFVLEAVHVDRRREWKPALLDEAHWDKLAADACEAIADVIGRMEPSARDLAATLGIPHEEPHEWTDEEVAMTLGIDVQRDGVVIGARMVRA